MNDTIFAMSVNNYSLTIRLEKNVKNTALNALFCNY